MKLQVQKVTGGIIANLGDIETSEVFFKDVSFYQEIEEISATHVFENLWPKTDEIKMKSEPRVTRHRMKITDEIEIIAILETVVQPH